MPALRPCVLLVERDPVVRRTLVRLLHAVAHVVDVDSGAAALTVLATGTVFDVALVDLSLEGMSGADLLEAIRKEHPYMASRFVAMTGEDPEELSGCAELRDVIGDRLLLKPVAREELLSVVIAVAGSSDAAAE